jgi:hypothetical protein
MHVRHPFLPDAGASTVALAVLATTAAIALPAVSDPSGGSIRVRNVGTNEVVVALGAAAVTAAIPVAGGAAGNMSIAPNSSEVFARTTGITHLAAIAGATGNTLFITAGQGA